MIPLGDSLSTRRYPVVTYLLILANIFGFFIELAQGPHLNRFLLRYGVVPVRIAQWQAHPWVLLTLITAQFLHGGWVHLIGNMIYLWIFGDNVEDELGHSRFLLLYLLSGVLGNVLQVLFSLDARIPAIGASGAVAGILGAYLLLYPRARVFFAIPLFFWFEVVSIPAVIALGFWFITQFFNGLASLAFATVQVGGVAWWAHVGGFLSGMLLGRVLRRPRPRYAERYYYLPNYPWW